MYIKNTEQSYGIVAKAFHWITVLMVFAMLSLGIWMVRLDYYNEWRASIIAIHKSIGVTLFAIIVLRIAWKVFNKKPRPLGDNKLENTAAAVVHILMYVVILSSLISGYLMATLGGQYVEVFGLFKLPPIIQLNSAGILIANIHEISAYTLIGLILLHVAGALKDKGKTLRRMT